MKDSAEEIFATLPVRLGVKVACAHPMGLLALDKPCGVRSHPNKAEPDPRALLTCPYDFEKECYIGSGADGTEVRFYLLNRLDSPTSGLILGTFSSELAVQVKRLFAEHKVIKKYYAVVKGRLDRLDETWSGSLQVSRQGGKLRVNCRTKGGKTALTRVRCVRATRRVTTCTLLTLEPKTGRTHQLRIQCAQHGLPIVGDATYGDFRFNRAVYKATGLKRLFLHASNIALRFGCQGRERTFKATSILPSTFTELLYHV